MTYNTRRLDTLCRLGIEQLPSFSIDEPHRPAAEQLDNISSPLHGDLPLRTMPVSFARRFNKPPQTLDHPANKHVLRSQAADAPAASNAARRSGSSRARNVHSAAPKSTKNPAAPAIFIGWAYLKGIRKLAAAPNCKSST